MREHPIWAALLRMAVGGVWLFEAYPLLLARDSYLGQGFVNTVQAMAVGNPWRFYRDFLERVVLPHASVFSYLTLAGNAVIGVCLLIGLLTPYSAFVAILLNANYGLAAGWMDRTGYALNGLMLVAELAIIGLA